MELYGLYIYRAKGDIMVDRGFIAILCFRKKI